MMKADHSQPSPGLCACGLSAALAQAERTGRFSGKGTDGGACADRALPSFTFALTQTAAGGEIDVLDPAGYGTLTIAKPISIFS